MRGFHMRVDAVLRNLRQRKWICNESPLEGWDDVGLMGCHRESCA